MDNDYEHLKLCQGQKGLFRNEISQKEVIEIIAHYPTSLWLDLFSKIDGFLTIPRGRDFDPQKFLAENLLCPSALERTKRPANSNSVFFTYGQLNLLRKLAIVYGNDSNQTEIGKIDISKVLLATQDIHNDYDCFVHTGEYENFCKSVLRNGYLNGVTDQATLFYRAKKMYVDQSAKLPIYPNQAFDDFFRQRVGLTPQDALSLNFALATPFFQTMETFLGQTAILPINYFGLTTIDQVQITSILDSMTIDFAGIKNVLTREIHEKKLGELPVGYDLSAFRKTPLIRLPDGRLVCVNLPCLFEKSTQNAIWMPTRGSYGTERQTLVNHLTHYRGLLFEEYLKELCSIMVSKNQNLSFKHIPPEATADHEEVGDSILIQGNKLIIFEAKSRQFLELFKTTGDWEKDPTFIATFVEASQQVETAATKIRSGQITGLNIDTNNIEKIYPVIVTYEPVPMHGKLQRLIRQKVAEAGHLTDTIFAPLEVVTIDDIENSIDAVNTITMVELLDNKNLGDPHASESNFNNFSSRYLGNNTVICNGWQRGQVNQTWDEVFRPFFEGKFK